MKIAITGATGFLGKRTAEMLTADGHKIIALGRNVKKVEDLKEKGIEVIACTLSDKEKLTEIFKGCDAVVHSAALSSAWGDYKDFYECNVEGTINVANACVDAEVKRLIHISTPSLYVTKSNKLQIKESDPLPPEAINFYAQTKKIAEEKLQEFKNLEYIILRPQGIFGPGDQALFPRLKRLADKGIIPIIGEGDNLVDLTYVDNVVHAIRNSLTAGQEALGEAFNITNDDPISNTQMLRKLMSELNVPVKEKKLSFVFAYNLAGVLEFVHRNFAPEKEPLLTKYSVCALSKTRTLSVDKARKLLGYQPIVPMEEGMKHYVSWCQTQM